MKRLMMIGLCVGLFLGVSGCSKSPHEAAADDGFALMNELCDIMDGVTDQNSAQAAVAKIEAWGTRMKAYAERAKALGTAPKEEMERLNTKMKPRVEKLQERMKTSMTKIGQYPTLMGAWLKAFSGMQMPGGGAPGGFGQGGFGPAK